MLNHLVVMGRIATDLELKSTPGGKPVLSFRVGIDRNKKKDDGTYETDWLTCVTWNGTAEFVAKHFQKGDPILLEGRIQSRDYNDRDGAKRSVTEMIVSQVYFAGGRKREQNNKPRPYYAPAGAYRDEDAPPELPY